VNEPKGGADESWVSPGPTLREEKKTVSFPSANVRIRWCSSISKFKDKTASIHLQWKPPHGVANHPAGSSFARTKFARRWW